LDLTSSIRRSRDYMTHRLPARQMGGEVKCKGCGRKREYTLDGVCRWCEHAWKKAIRRNDDKLAKHYIRESARRRKDREHIWESKRTLQEIRRLLRCPEALRSARQESQQQRSSLP